METTNSNTNSNSNSKFRFQGIKMFMTYPGHHDAGIIDRINEIMSQDRGKNTVDEFIIGRETGETGYQHTHVVIKFAKKLCFQNARKFDMGDSHPKIEPVRDWAEAVHYAAKDGEFDTNIDLANLIPIQKKIDNIMNAKTVREALKNAKNMSEVMPTIKMFEVRNQRGVIPFKPLETLRPWQDQLFSILSNCMSNRRIYWVYDKRGGSGKTAFQKHMLASKEGVMLLPGASTSSNINEAVRGFLDENARIEYMMINLARGTECYSSIYQTLEQVKDQMLFCPKYKSKVIYLEVSPVICVFANNLPEVEKLTKDRWCIYELHDGELTSVPVTLGTEEERVVNMLNGV